MKIISTVFHGILDYVTVLFLAISPSLFDMTSPAAVFTYALAGIHLLLTALTNFEMGIFKIIPLKIHGAIELIVSVFLVIVAVLFYMSDDKISFYFYLVFAIVLFIVWVASSYTTSPGGSEAGGRLQKD